MSSCLKLTFSGSGSFLLNVLAEATIRSATVFGEEL